MHAKNALFGRNTKAQRKSVMTCAAMDVHAIGSARPEAMIWNLVAEETKEGPSKPEAHETNLTSMRVPREHEIAVACW